MLRTIKPSDGVSVEEALAKQKSKRNKKSKESPSEILNDIIDKKALEQRKARGKKKNTQEPERIIPKEKQWWEKPITVKEFIIKEHKGVFYGRLPYWKENIWIGAYNTQAEIDTVIKNYCKCTSSKNKYKKDIPNLHSTILTIDD